MEYISAVTVTVTGYAYKLVRPKDMFLSFCYRYQCAGLPSSDVSNAGDTSPSPSPSPPLP